MISTEVIIPEDCHIIVDGIDFAGKRVWNNRTHLDGTGEFSCQDIYSKRNEFNSYTSSNIKKIQLDKEQTLQLSLAFHKQQERYLEEQLFHVKERIKLMESGTWPIPIEHYKN